MGEYRTPLYFNKNEVYKSTVTGVFTILIALLLIVLALFIFIPIFKKTKYEIDE